MAIVSDLIGSRFGRLEALNRLPNNKHGQARWSCKCDCGNIKDVDASRLKSGMTKSCGCLVKEVHSKIHDQDITGKRIHSLVAIRRIEKINKKGWIWLFKCDCGNERLISAGMFNSGTRKSCGCKTGENISNGRKTHGKSNTRAYWLRSLAKKRSRDNGLPFNLSIEFVENLIEENKFCYYLGIELKTNVGKLSWNSATMDRFIPELGYTEGNVMLISHRANTIKNNASVDEIIKVAIGFARLSNELPKLLSEVRSAQITITH